MKTLLVERSENGQRIYNSILVDPKNLSIFHNDLSVKIISEIAKDPQCAMDVAKKLNVHEQKVYYYLRKFKEVGIVKMTREESRYGMTAKIFSIVSPVIAAKLYEDGMDIEGTDPLLDATSLDFFYPFIAHGKLTAKVVFGDPYPHGEYDAVSKDGLYIYDLALLFGKIIKELEFLNYTLDTEVRKEDFNKNLILVGHAKTNVLINKINDSLPIFFNKEKGWAIESKTSKRVYDDPRIGMVVKCGSPFNHKKKILVIGGNGTRGTKASIIALTQHTNKVAGIINDEKTGIVVEGVDKDGDMIIDSARILE